MMHCEKRRSFVCWSEMELLRDVMHFLIVSKQVEKNFLAKDAEPTGWRRRLHPVVISTGSGGALGVFVLVVVE